MSSITSLRSSAIRGSMWTMFGYGGGQILRFGSNLVLSRLLFPADFGKMALVGVFFQGMQMFSDVGIGPSIIQNPRGEDPDFYNTAWTIQVGRGFMLWITAVLLARPMAWFYGQHDLLYLLPVMAFTAVIGGFNSTTVFRLSRNIDLKKTTMLELGSQLVTLIVMISWAMVSRSVWALVAGNLANSLTRMIASHFLIRGHRCKFHWDRHAAGELFSFGRWIFVSTVLTFFAGQADRIIFGKQIPPAMLGVYQIAFMLASMPTQAIIRIAGPVTFSVYSRLGSSRSSESLGEVFAQLRFPLLIFGGWAIAGLLVTGPALVHLLYDPRYAAAAWMLQLLVVSAWFEILETTNGSALLALGKPWWTAFANGAKLVGLVTFIPLGFLIGGKYGNAFEGAVVALVLSEMLRYGSTAIAIHAQGFGSFARDMSITAITAVSAAIALTVEHELKRWSHAIVLPTLAAAGCVCLFWFPLAYRAYRTIRTSGRREEIVEPAAQLLPVEMA